VVDRSFLAFAFPFTSSPDPLVISDLQRPSIVPCQVIKPINPQPPFFLLSFSSLLDRPVQFEGCGRNAAKLGTPQPISPLCTSPNGDPPLGGTSFFLEDMPPIWPSPSSPSFFWCPLPCFSGFFPWFCLIILVPLFVPYLKQRHPLLQNWSPPFIPPSPYQHGCSIASHLKKSNSKFWLCLLFFFKPHPEADSLLRFFEIFFP